MWLAEFACAPLAHLLTVLDEESGDPAQCGRTAAICGYTEWVSDTAPAISIGWDWQLDLRHGQVRCRRAGEPRSNIMLVNSRLQDLGPHRTAVLLGNAIDQKPWQELAINVLRTKYSGGYLSNITVT